MANFNDLSIRLITGMLLFSLIFASGYFFGASGFAGIFALMGIICLNEWGRLCGLNGYKLSLYVVGIFLPFIIVNQAPAVYVILILSLPILLSMHFYLNKLPLTTGVVYISLAIFSVLEMLNKSLWWADILIIWVTVIAVDIGAYIFGRIIGGKQLAPKISPNKTIAGFIGGITIGGIAFAVSINILSYVENVLFTFVFGVILSAFSQMGDLYQSNMKRIAGVKDSGKILPGHGGIFDRIDGLLMALVFVLLFNKLSMLIDYII